MSSTTVKEFAKALSLCNGVVTRDCFGRTAFHIVATSFNPRTDILAAILDKFGNEALYHRDMYGTTMLDYMLMNSSSIVIPLIKTVLHRTTVNAISGLALERWRSTISSDLAEFSEDDNNGNKSQHTLGKIRDQVVLYSKLEMTSLFPMENEEGTNEL